MKWFRKLFKQEPEEEQEEPKEQEIDFTDSMFIEIAQLKLNLENIKSEEKIYQELKQKLNEFEKYVEKISERMEQREIESIEKKINYSTNIVLELEDGNLAKSSDPLIQRVGEELSIEEYFADIKKIYEVKYRQATQRILMDKLEKFNTNLYRFTFSARDDSSKISISEIQEYFDILKSQKDEFKGINQNRYVEGLIELQYRISLIKLIEKPNTNYIKAIENADIKTEDEAILEFIEQAQQTKGRELIYSRLLIEDIETLSGKIQKVKEKYEEADTNGIIDSTLKEMNLSEDLERNISEVERLRDLVINSKDNIISFENRFNQILVMIDKLKIDGKDNILDKEVINKFLEEIRKLQNNRNIIKDIEKLKELQDKVAETISNMKKEQEKQQEELKTISTTKMSENIRQLDDESFDIKTSYQDILRYQIEIGQAKGLLDEKSLMQTQDMQIIRVSINRLPIMIQRLIEAKCNYEIYPDADNSDENMCIAIPKDREISNKFNDETFEAGFAINLYEENIFLGRDLAEMLKERSNRFIGNKLYFYANMLRIVDKNTKTLVENEIKKIHEMLSSYCKESIKTYIEIPYLRPIIPILEKLQENGIEYTILPPEQVTTLNEPSVKIYMNRNDLERYKEQVHSQISTSENGVVRIGREDIDLWGIISKGCGLQFKEERISQESEEK